MVRTLTISSIHTHLPITDKANNLRTLPNSASRKQQRIPLHRLGGMVRRTESHREGDVDWDGSCSCGDWDLRAV